MTDTTSVYQCRFTGQNFTLLPGEAELYTALGFPLPDLAHTERLRRLMAFRSGGKLFWRNCDATDERVYSVYSANAPFPVIDRELWSSRAFDPYHYGREVSFQLPFQEQYAELWSVVPRPSVSGYQINGSVATHDCFDASACYLVSGSMRVDRCMYSTSLRDCVGCIDCHELSSSTDCYESTHCVNCDKVRWSENSSECEESWFLSNCRRCKHCLFCANLEDAEYCILNEQVSPVEFKRVLGRWALMDKQGVERAKTRFREFLKDRPTPHLQGFDSEHVSGNYLTDCRDVGYSFDCLSGKDLWLCVDLAEATQCVEGIGLGGAIERSGQFVGVAGSGMAVLNAMNCYGGLADIEYSAHCENSSHLFGCIGIRNGEYCILNKQYTRESYTALRNRIIASMSDAGDWLRFVPRMLSEFPYNHSTAQDFLPLNDTQCGLLGYRWEVEDDSIKPSTLLEGLGVQGESSPAQRLSDIPDRLVPEDRETLPAQLFLCEMSGQPYQLSTGEIECYLEWEIAPPVRAPRQRYLDRLNRLAPRTLAAREVGESGERLVSAYPKTWNRPVVDARRLAMMSGKRVNS